MQYEPFVHGVLMRHFLLCIVTLLCVTPLWADNSKILFSSARGNSGGGDIYSMNPDGTGLLNLSNSASYQDVWPTVKPDGTKIVYVRTGGILGIMNADGTGQTTLISSLAPTLPDYDPTGQKIVFSGSTGDYDLYVMNADGTGQTRLVANQYGDYYPRYSPDGSKISFYTFSGTGPVPDIYVVNANGTGQVKLTSTGKDTYADWSPDSTQLVFQSTRDGNNEIYVMNADGTNQTRLTNNAATDAYPVFSPDGTKIAFVSNRDGNNEIYVMNADGSGQTRITNDTADDTSPTWTLPVPAGSPSLSVSDVAVTEGDAGATDATVTISLSAPSASTVTVNYRTLDGTATAGTDYTAVPNTTVTFAPGETSKTISVSVTGDLVNEVDETLNVRLYSPVNASIADANGIVTILNDDTPPTLSIDDVTLAEGDSGTTDAVFTVTLSRTFATPVSVNYASANGTAVVGSDYTATSGTLNIPAGQTSGTIAVPVIGDTILEADETFFVNLTSPSNSTIFDGQGKGTITNDDTVPGLSISDATVTEGADATFTVSITGAIAQPVTVDYATVNDTATAGSDYTAKTGTLTIPAGQTSATVTVSTLVDTSPENTETFTVNLTNPANATVLDDQGVGTITNTNVPDVFVSDVAMREGNTGPRAMYFTVALSDPAAFAVSVNYATANSSAVTSSDYTAASGSVSFAAGETSKSVAVNVNGDKTYENDETFFVNLSGAVNSNISVAQGKGTIVNDDPLPAVQIANTSVVEGNSGTTNASFTLTLSNPSAFSASVDYTTIDGTATAPNDYLNRSGTVTFLSNQTSRTILIPVVGDTVLEANETFSVKLGNPVGAQLLGNPILNPDNGHYYEMFASSTNWEGDKTAAESRSFGGVNGHLATIASQAEQTFLTNIVSTSGNGAWVGGYQPAGSPEPAGNFQWITGEPFTYTNWRQGEPNNAPTAGPADAIMLYTDGTWNDASSSLEMAITHYVVEYDVPAGTTDSRSSAVCTIINDDSTPAVSISDASITEGNAGTVNLNFTVSTPIAPPQSWSVHYATANGTASSSSDYTAKSGTLAVPAGQTSGTISISVKGDTLYEADETFLVNLTSPTNATIADAQGVGTITNDDAVPSLSIADVSIAEGNSGTVNLTFTVVQSAVSGLQTKVNFATADETATAPADYTARNTVLTIPVGQTSVTQTVPIKVDTVSESDETFLVNLTNAINATIADSQAVGTIINDD
jgi:chitinase